MNKVLEKLNELAKLAEQEGDYNTLIVVNILLGSKFSGDDGLLAAEMQKYTIEVLMPRAEMGSRGISLN